MSRVLRLIDGTERICKCIECGRAFPYGTEADNETLCLRCEHLLLGADRESSDYGDDQE